MPFDEEAKRDLAKADLNAFKEPPKEIEKPKEEIKPVKKTSTDTMDFLKQIEAQLKKPK